jgi:phage host-nuclease inhibitor protein Gam
MALLRMTNPQLMPDMAPTQMAAPEVQDPTHALIAPISAAPPEPMPFSGAYLAAMEGDQGPYQLAVKQPKVRTMSPTERYEQQLEQKQMADYAKDQNPYGSENNHPGFFGKFLHGLSVATGGPNRRQFEEEQRGKELAGIETQRLGQEAQQANIEHTQQQIAAGQPVEISPDQAQELDAPELAGTMVAPSVLATLYKQRGINAQREAANQLTNQTRRDVANIGAISREKLATLKPEQRDDRAIRLNQKAAQGQPLTQEEQAYLKAYSQYIDQTKVQPGVQRAIAFGQFRPVQTIDPDTGDVVYQWSGNAVRSGAATPQSMNFRTATGMAKFMTSGKGGQTITAYNTANDHLELLGKAMDALQNGDVQGLNQLNNAFKQQFGSSAPTNVDAVKAMLAGELANVAKVTGATDPEIEEQKRNINRASSPEQIRGFIDTNHELMDQKAYELYQQYQQGLQGKPAFDTGLSGHRPANGAGNQGPKVLKFNAATGRLE